MLTQDELKNLHDLYDGVARSAQATLVRKALSDECSVIYGKTEPLHIQQYSGCWLHFCLVPNWKSGWEYVEEYVREETHWKYSLYQNTEERLQKVIACWRGMPDGEEKDTFFDRFICDNVRMTQVKPEFYFPMDIPEDVQMAMERAGFVP